MTRTDVQRGSIIIYAMLTMSAMLAIGLALSGLFIGKLKSSAASRDSTIAIYLADSAVEMCLYEARQSSPQPPLDIVGGASYTITQVPAGTDITDDCSLIASDSFQFRATGIYRGVRRTLEISQ